MAQASERESERDPGRRGRGSSGDLSRGTEAAASVLLCVCIGLVFSAGWTNSLHVARPSGGSWAPMLFSEVLNVLTFLGCVLLPRQFERTFLHGGRRQAVCLLAIGIAATAGRALFSVTQPAPTPAGWTLFAYTALFSVAEPVLILAFLATCCRDLSSHAKAILPGSLLVSGALMTAAFAASSTLGIAIANIAPLLSAVLYLAYVRLAGRSGPGSNPDGKGSGNAPQKATAPAATSSDAPRARLPLWPLALMLGYDFVYHIVTTLDTASALFGTFGQVAIALVALLVALLGRRYSPTFLNKVALPLVVVSLMLVSTGGLGQNATALLSNMGSASFYLFLLITFAMMCQRHEFDPVRSFGMLLVSEHLGHVLGIWAGVAIAALAPAGGTTLQAVATAVAALLIVLSTVLCSDLEVAREFGLVPTTLHLDGGAGRSQLVLSVMSPYERIAWQCARVAREYSLTMREEQILEHMLHGSSVADIAEQECVSPGTVKAHMSRIYRKLGVSTRQEAVSVALVERDEQTGRRPRRSAAFDLKN